MSDVRNVYVDEWDELHPQVDGWRADHRRLAPPGSRLGMMLYELHPKQTQCAYHFHHGNEELLLVLRGRPTLRTPDGETELEPGDVVHFGTGPAGAHHVVNRSDEPVRYVIADAKVSPEVVEYPDSGKLAAMAKTPDKPLWTMHRLDAEVGYYDGEEPRA